MNVTASHTSHETVNYTSVPYVDQDNLDMHRKIVQTITMMMEFVDILA